MILGLTTSTVTIGNRSFPAVCVICPPVANDPDPGDDRDRMLGGRGGVGTPRFPTSDQVYIPCENGVFVAVEAEVGKSGYTVTLHSRTCEQAPWDDSRLWVPYNVGIAAGTLITVGLNRHLSAPWRWTDADPDWTVEFIDRVSRMPFTQPYGPQVRLIPIGEAFDRV